MIVLYLLLFAVANLAQPAAELVSVSRIWDDRLMMVAGGSVCEGKRYLGRQPRVTFSPDGKTAIYLARVKVR
jgi:hypothetical protein